MQRVTLGNLPNSFRVREIARMRTQNVPQSSDLKLTHAGALTALRPQVRALLTTVLTWLSPPQNIKSVFRSEGHYHMDRAFSVWK